MPKYVKEKLPTVAVSALINENMDSMTLSDYIQEWLKAFEEFEKEEDKLKEYIAEKLIKADPQNKMQYEHILSQLLKIDFYQDKIIEKILNAAKTIFKENRESNNILKPFEIYTKQRLYKKIQKIKSESKTLFLWRWNDDVAGDEKRVRRRVVSSNQNSEKEKSLASVARP